MTEASAKATVLIDLGRHIGDGAGRLHLLLRDAPGEVVVEEGDRLPQRPAVQAATAPAASRSARR